jgi:hypothetical protein
MYGREAFSRRFIRVTLVIAIAFIAFVICAMSWMFPIRPLISRTFCATSHLVRSTTLDFDV